MENDIEKIDEQIQKMKKEVNDLPKKDNSPINDGGGDTKKINHLQEVKISSNVPLKEDTKKMETIYDTSSEEKIKSSTSSRKKDDENDESSDLLIVFLIMIIILLLLLLVIFYL